MRRLRERCHANYVRIFLPLATLGGFAAYAAEPYEGIWAYSQTECRDLDGVIPEPSST